MSDESHSPHSATSHGEDHAHDWNAHIRAYIKVGIILIIFTGITYAAAFWPIFDLHSRGRNIALGLAIATFKASLVALIFMHLKGERNIIYKLLLFTAFFAFAMVFLILFTNFDPIPADPAGRMIHHG